MCMWRSNVTKKIEKIHDVLERRVLRTIFDPVRKNGDQATTDKMDNVQDVHHVWNGQEECWRHGWWALKEGQDRELVDGTTLKKSSCNRSGPLEAKAEWIEGTTLSHFENTRFEL